MLLSLALSLLSLSEYVHVCVREMEKGTYNYLGGGSADRIIKRFGDREIIKTNIEQNALIIYVSPR